ncbi:MAG: biotin/lipoyl-binding protein, partial [Acidobacteria bacterium]|nr:biotin/lipoyl-binding protein [Acidobacteriota bacterium]
MTLLTRLRRPTPAALASALLLLGTVACGGGTTAPAPAAAPAGPVTIDMVHVVEAPLDVQLSLPGELTAYQSVAIFPRVSGFVKTVPVDRGSRVRAGDVLATLEAPELVARRSEAQSKLQAAEAEVAG